MQTTSVKLYSLEYDNAKTYLAAALFVAGNIALPQLFHTVRLGGPTWLPIYFFTLIAAYKFYCDKDLTNAHSAEADTLATYEVLKAQLDRYDNLENDIDFLAEFSTRNESADFAGRILYNEKGEEVFGFGKYKGRCVAEIFELEPSYYNWMMNGDFPLYTKKVITEIRLRGKEEKKR